MVMRFWLAVGVVTMSGLAGGIGLGSYVTHIPAPVPASYKTDDTGANGLTGALAESGPSSDGVRGPAQIDCKGCGPTLAERRMAGLTEPAAPSYEDSPAPDYAMAPAIDDPAPSRSPAIMPLGDDSMIRSPTMAQQQVQPRAQDSPAP